jgi:preprotein translocase subunit YajC
MLVAVAYAQAAGGSGTGPNPLVQFLPLILIFAVFYFLLIRPQQKKAKEHQNFLQALKKGDNVVTNGGIHGKITGITDKVVTVEIADNVRIKVSRSHILGTPAAVEEGKPASGG